MKWWELYVALCVVGVVGTFVLLLGMYFERMASKREKRIDEGVGR